MHAAGIQARHVEQAVQQFLGRAQRGVDAFGEVALFGGFVRLSRNAEVNSRAAFSGCSTSWLIAARKRVFDCCAASASRLRRSATRCSSVLVDFEQRGLGALVVGDVAVAGDVAAARQRLAAHLDHAAVAAHALEDVRRAGAHVADALARPAPRRRPSPSSPRSAL